MNLHLQIHLQTHATGAEQREDGTGGAQHLQVRGARHQQVSVAVELGGSGGGVDASRIGGRGNGGGEPSQQEREGGEERLRVGG